MQFYSQQHEDQFLLKHFFPKKTNGFFIELGALDGVLYSNTKFFEDERGWNGILIEAAPNLFEQLKQNRPNCELHHCAVCETNGEVEFIGTNAVAGMVHTYDKNQMKHWQEKQLLPSSDEMFKVPSRRFDSIVKHNRIKKVDFMVVDVEGGEIEVLNSFDWKIDVSVLIYEASSSGSKINRQNTKACMNLAKNLGYTRLPRLGGNEVWYRKDLIEFQR